MANEPTSRPIQLNERPGPLRQATAANPAGFAGCKCCTHMVTERCKRWGIRAHKQKRRLGFPKRRFVFEHRRGEFLVLGRPGGDLLSQGLSHSTIGAEEFNGRVRDGIGLRLFAKTTRPAKDKKTKQAIFMWRLAPLIHSGQDLAILWTLKMRAIKPIERLVPVSYMHYCTSTSGLSTWSSSTVLKGMLVLRWVSRLDAFSGYPVRT